MVNNGVCLFTHLDGAARFGLTEGFPLLKRSAPKTAASKCTSQFYVGFSFGVLFLKWLLKFQGLGLVWRFVLFIQVSESAA